MELSIDRLTKQYDNVLAVDCFSTKLSPGVYGLLGANGSGKTTLMKLICDILVPTSGEIYYNGISIRQLGEDYRNILGYLPQSFGFYPTYTAYKFLLYMASLKGIPVQAAKEKSSELLSAVGLWEQKDRKIKTFSGGMKQRLGIAQAMLNDPEVLILDEPTAGLDPKERVHFRNLISSLSKNKIVLLSTHIVSDLSYIAKEILIMKNGNLIHRGTKENLLEVISEKVWECAVDASLVSSIEEVHTIINMTLVDDMANLRIVSDETPVFSAKPAKANLEDLYLYYFDEEVNRHV